MPRCTATPYFLRISLPWYSWMFMVNVGLVCLRKKWRQTSGFWGFMKVSLAGSGFLVPGSIVLFRVPGSYSSGFLVPGSWFRVPGFWFRVPLLFLTRVLLPCPDAKRFTNVEGAGHTEELRSTARS